MSVWLLKPAAGDKIYGVERDLITVNPERQPLVRHTVIRHISETFA